MKKKLVSPSFLKQLSKKLKREHSVSQHEALDMAAKKLGHTNYKNYQNELAAGLKEIEASKGALLNRIQSEADEAQKVKLATALMDGYKISFGEVFDILARLQQSEAVVQLICEKANLKDEIRTSLLKYFLDSRGDVQALPLMEHFVAKAVSVRGLEYGFGEDKVRVFAEYDIEFEFESEVPDELKHLPHFKRGPMFGEFAATIDRRKKVAIDEPTIGERDGNSFYMGSFKLGRH